MNLDEQASVDRFMMSDSLKGIIPDIENLDLIGNNSPTKITITSSTQTHLVIGRLISINRSDETVTLILQLKNDDRINILNDAKIIGQCDVDVVAGQYYQYSGEALVTNVGLEMNVEGPRISVTINGTSKSSG
jgi:hypothetical protein